MAKNVYAEQLTQAFVPGIFIDGVATSPDFGVGQIMSNQKLEVANRHYLGNGC